MSKNHLAKGSTKPAKVEDKIRLYSMEFCPFALRSRLILLIKQVPHDIVNIHLKNKPDWYLEINPKGAVPSMDTGSEIISESLDICDYLDEKYPEPALYPKDETKCAQDKALMKEFGKITELFYIISHDLEGKSFSAYMERVLPLVKKYENELKSRGGVYFGGEKPSMLDYMLYPWAPRSHTLKLIFKEDLPGPKEFPCLYAWCEAMGKLKVIQETSTEIERLYRLNRMYVAGPQAVDYDII